MNNIQSRKSIHDRKTPQREGSQHEENNEDSASMSDSNEDDESTIEGYKATSKVSHSPEQNKQKNPSMINNKCVSEVVFQWKYVMLLLVTIVAYCYHQGQQRFYSHQSEQRNCSFENFRNEYPKEIVLWKHLQLGIEMILNKKIEKPAVYLLAHHGKNNSHSLITKIAEHSSKCFGKDLVPMNDFVQDTGSLDDYGYVIEKYKSKIKEGDVFLIANLNEIPAKAARAFHAICDTHSPIRNNVVIFLELTIKGNREGNSHHIAEETLTELWGSEIEQYELNPLITRVTDQVFILQT